MVVQGIYLEVTTIQVDRCIVVQRSQWPWCYLLLFGEAMQTRPGAQSRLSATDPTKPEQICQSLL